jgi:glycosyltransferase involved in cell wall biosynthesis
MRVGIYVEVLRHPELSGIGRHVRGLVNALSSLDKETTYLLYHVDSPGSRETILSHIDSRPNVHLRTIPLSANLIDKRPRVFWDVYLPFVLLLDRLAVFHGPNYFVPAWSLCRRVVTIHDLAFFHTEVHGDTMDRIMRYWTERALASAHRIIAISNSTREDCIAAGAQAQKVLRIYQGFERASAEDGGSRSVDQTGGDLAVEVDLACDPYILYVGTLQPRKNLSILVEALYRLRSTIPHKLILAGAKGDSYADLKRLVERFGLQERVVFTGYVDDDVRKALYQNADLFVYPSLYEGFGLVLLEAMSFGVPCIAADNSSLPEAGGDAAAFFDARSADHLAGVIARLAGSAEERERRVTMGHTHIDKFDWRSCAEDHLQVYKSLAFSKAKIE